MQDADDAAPDDPHRCGQDADADGCDDCAAGVVDVYADGVDLDGDGACALLDPDELACLGGPAQVLGGDHILGLGVQIAPAGDLNADGWPDVVVLSGGGPRYWYNERVGEVDPSVSLLWGGPDGLRRSPELVYDWIRLVQGEPGDVNGDGVTDLLIGSDPLRLDSYSGAEVYAPPLRLYEGGPDGVGRPDWTWQPTLADGQALFTTWAGDLNGDGLADFAVAGSGLVRPATRFAGGLNLWLGSVDGPVLAAELPWPEGFQGGSAGMVAVGDVDHDGRDDLVVADQRGHPWRVRGALDGVFALEDLGPGPDGLSTDGMLAGDFTGDGAVDLLMLETYLPSAVLWRGDGAGGFVADARQTLPLDGLDLETTVVADVDSDGAADLVTPGAPERGESAWVLWVAGGPDGLGDVAQALLAGAAHLRGQAEGVALIDLDRDGDDELLVGAPSAGDDVANQGWVLRWDGPVDRSAPEPSPAWRGQGQLWAHGGGDVDGDGISDLVLTTGAGRAVFRGGPGGLATAPEIAPLPAEEAGTAWSPAGDLDGDGRGDWIGLSGDHRSWWSATAAAPEVWSPASAISLATGDLDGDGYGDVTDGWGVYRGGPAGPQAMPAWTFARPGHPVLAQLDHDAADDLLLDGVVDFETAYFAVLGSADGPVDAWTWRPDAVAPELVQQLDPFGIGWARSPAKLVNVGDVDGDGYADLVYADPAWADAVSAVDVARAVATTPGRLLWLPGGPRAPQTGWSFGFHRRIGQLLGADRAGDLNGDGYADVVARFSGRWQGGTAFAVWYGSPTGPDRVTVGPCDAAGADVVQGVGDVNADGYDDLALSWSALGSVWVLYGGPDGVGLAVQAPPADAGGGHALAEAVTRPLSPPPSSIPAPEAPCGCATTRPAPLPLAALLLCARARRRR